MAPKCKHLNRIPYEDHEESSEFQGESRTIRIQQWECPDCDMILANRVHMDAVASNRAVDDHYGVTYV